jgi:hypothetical protein
VPRGRFTQLIDLTQEPLGERSLIEANISLVANSCQGLHLRDGDHVARVSLTGQQHADDQEVDASPPEIGERLRCTQAWDLSNLR